MRRRVARLERGDKRDRVGGSSHVEPPGEVHLVAVAGLDVLEDRRDTPLELVASRLECQRGSAGEAGTGGTGRPPLRRPAPTGRAPRPCPCSSDRPDAGSSTARAAKRARARSGSAGSAWCPAFGRRRGGRARPRRRARSSGSRPTTRRQPVEQIQRVGADATRTASGRGGDDERVRPARRRRRRSAGRAASNAAALGDAPAVVCAPAGVTRQGSGGARRRSGFRATEESASAPVA